MHHQFSYVKHPLSLGIALSIGLLLTSIPMQAKEIKDPAAIAATAKSAGLISMEEAIQKALAVKPGKLKKVELEEYKKKSGWGYEVEIIDAQGKEWDVELDAKTGSVLEVKQD
jgi:uncharacterized membrane protein YkoI